MPQSIVRELWCNNKCSWVSLDADKCAGGILLGWNNRQYTFLDHYIGYFLVSVVLVDKTTGFAWIISSVYGPTDRRLRGSFWCELGSIHSRWLALGVLVVTRISPDSLQKNLEVAALQ